MSTLKVNTSPSSFFSSPPLHPTCPLFHWDLPRVAHLLWLFLTQCVWVMISCLFFFTLFCTAATCNLKTQEAALSHKCITVLTDNKTHTWTHVIASLSVTVNYYLSRKAYPVNWISVVFQQSSWHCPLKERIYDNDVEKAHTNPSESEVGDGRAICSCYWSKLRGHAWQATATYLHNIDGWASSRPPTFLRNGPCCSSFRPCRLWETIFSSGIGQCG